MKSLPLCRRAARWTQCAAHMGQLQCEAADGSAPSIAAGSARPTMTLMGKYECMHHMIALQFAVRVTVAMCGKHE